MDLPTKDERKEILSVHLRKRRRMNHDFDLERLARESEGYVGAEIEQAIIDLTFPVILLFQHNRQYSYRHKPYSSVVYCH